MKKRKLVLYSLLVVLLISFSGFQYYKQQRIHNIFDEIYYEESDYHAVEFLWRRRAFRNLKEMKIIDVDSKESERHRVEYDAKFLPDNVTYLIYSFHFSDPKNPYMIIDIRLKVPSTDHSINVNYYYYPKSATFDRYMWYYDDESSGYYRQSQVEAFLAEHGKTVEDIRKEADDVLRNKVLKDWTSIYSSHFSTKNWGEVTVKDIWRDDLSKN